MSHNNLELIDGQLLSLGLERKEIPKDGACLFRCISEFIYGSQVQHRYVRQKCVEYLVKNRDTFEPFACINDPWERYIELMAKDDTWGGEIELQALSLYYKVNFVIYIGTTTTNVDNSYPNTISLAYCQGEHYDIVYPASHLSNLKSMQSLIYDILASSPLSIQTDTSQWYNNAMMHWEEQVKIKQKKDLKIVETLSMNKRVYVNPVDEYQLKQKKEREKLEREREREKKKNQPRNRSNVIRSSGGSDDGSGSNASTPSISSPPSLNNSMSNTSDMIYPAMDDMDEELRAIIKQIEQQDIEEQRKIGMEKHFPTLPGGKPNRNKQSQHHNNHNDGNIVTTATVQQPAQVDVNVNVNVNDDGQQTTITATATVAKPPAWKITQDWNQIKENAVVTTTPVTATPVTVTTNVVGDSTKNTTNTSTTDSNDAAASLTNAQFRIKTKNRRK